MLLENLRKLTNPSVRIAGVRTCIATRHLQKSGQNCKRLLGVVSEGHRKGV
jgi:hypothetical protein